MTNSQKLLRTISWVQVATFYTFIVLERDEVAQGILVFASSQSRWNLTMKADLLTTKSDAEIILNEARWGSVATLVLRWICGWKYLKSCEAPFQLLLPSNSQVYFCFSLRTTFKLEFAPILNPPRPSGKQISQTPSLSFLFWRT